MNFTCSIILPVILGSAFPLLSHTSHGQTADRFIETFTMPMEDWTRIPAAIRDDSAQLYQRCLDALASGKIERIDRIGGPVVGPKTSFSAEHLIQVPTTFILKDGKVSSGEITNENVGSRFNFGVFGKKKEMDGKSLPSIRYDRTPPSVASAAMLGKGSREDLKATEIPVREPIRLNTSIPVEFHGTHLMGVVPFPVMGGKATKLALIFHTGGSSESASPSVGVMVEFLLLRGTSGVAQGDAPQRIKSLLSQRGSIETIVALRSTPNAKGYVSGETEWTYPTSAAIIDGVLVPQNLEPMGQGTTLEIQCLAMDDEGTEIQFAINHDLAKPEFPVASGKGAILLTPDNVKVFRAYPKAKLTLLPNVWTAVEEIPLAPILGPTNPAAKNQSCYVFVRARPDVR